MMTAHSDVHCGAGNEGGAADFMVKPFDLDHLIVVIEKNLEFAHLESRVQLLQEELESERSRSGIIVRKSARRCGAFWTWAEKFAHGETTNSAAGR